MNEARTRTAAALLALVLACAFGAAGTAPGAALEVPGARVEADGWRVWNAPETTHLPSQNRVWEFFGVTPDRVRLDASQLPDVHWETWLCAYEFASDVGDGPNLYAYVRQNPWSAFDPLGLQEAMRDQMQFLESRQVGNTVEAHQKQIEYEQMQISGHQRELTKLQDKILALPSGNGSRQEREALFKEMDLLESLQDKSARNIEMAQRIIATDVDGDGVLSSDEIDALASDVQDKAIAENMRLYGESVVFAMSLGRGGGIRGGGAGKSVNPWTTASRIPARPPLSPGFKSGEVITRAYKSGDSTIEMAAEAVIKGRTLHLKNIAVFPKGVDKVDIGVREVVRLRAQLAADAKSMGFDTLKVTGTRVTGANPGKGVDFTIDLTTK